MAKVEKILYTRDQVENKLTLDNLCALFEDNGIRGFDDPIARVTAWYTCQGPWEDFEEGFSFLAFEVDEDYICDEEDLFSGDFKIGSELGEIASKELSEEMEDLDGSLVFSTIDEEGLLEGIMQGLITRTPYVLDAYPVEISQEVDRLWTDLEGVIEGGVLDTAILTIEQMQKALDDMVNIATTYHHILSKKDEAREGCVYTHLAIDGVNFATIYEMEEGVLLRWRGHKSPYEKHEFCKELNWTKHLKASLLEECEDGIDSALEQIKIEQDYSQFLMEMGELEATIYRLQDVFGISPKADLLKALATNQVDMIKEMLAR